MNLPALDFSLDARYRDIATMGIMYLERKRREANRREQIAFLASAYRAGTVSQAHPSKREVSGASIP